MNELALFAGAGGGILGGKLLGWRTICAVEYNAYARNILLARQNDGTLPPFPIWDDVCTFDGAPWRGRADVVSGGFPCQDISAAGKGGGLEGERSGLWSEMARIIRDVQPRHVFVENSPMLTSRGLGKVLGDLAEMGFDAEWGVVSAADTGAPHLRERIWIVADASGGRCLQSKIRQMEQPRRAEIVCAGNDLAYTQSERCGKTRELRLEQPEERSACRSEEMADSDSLRELQQEGRKQDIRRRPGNDSARIGRGAIKSRLGGMDDELADRLDFIGAIES